MPPGLFSASMGELESNLADDNKSARTLPFLIDPASRWGHALRQRRRMPEGRQNSITPHSVTLVLGGVRSGKSQYAQQLGERASRVVFVATAEARDEEMQRKVQRHRETRPAQWQTVEEPLGLAQVIGSHGPGCDVMIIDCLTFFAANLLEAQPEDPASNQAAIEALCAALGSPPCSVVLVSNEVGSGVVPAYALGRRFRDLLGEMNQSVARVASNVLLLVAGLPLVLKGHVEVAQ